MPTLECAVKKIGLSDFARLAESTGYSKKTPRIFVKGDYILLRTTEGGWSHLKGKKLVARGVNWADLFAHLADYHGLLGELR